MIIFECPFCLLCCLFDWKVCLKPTRHCQWTKLLKAFTHCIFGVWFLAFLFDFCFKSVVCTLVALSVPWVFNHRVFGVPSLQALSLSSRWICFFKCGDLYIRVCSRFYIKVLHFPLIKDGLWLVFVSLVWGELTNIRHNFGK